MSQLEGFEQPVSAKPLKSILGFVHFLGNLLVEDDINDFLRPGAAYPWDPMTGGPGHVVGGPHHGTIGFVMKTFAELGHTALTLQEISDAMNEPPDQITLWQEKFEQILYPEP